MKKPNELSEISKNKLFNYLDRDFRIIDKPTILEFGVRKGHSTKYFLDLCNKNKGKCYSIDMNDYSNLFQNENWKFIHSMDDNFEYIKKQIPKSFDIIFLDTLHEADHVEKILYHYYHMLKTGGFFIIDDISWVPYLKNSWRDNFNLETENRKTFELLIDIFLSNQDNIKLDFSFTASGLAKIQKINDTNLNKKKHINSRLHSIKYFIKSLKNFFLKK